MDRFGDFLPSDSEAELDTPFDDAGVDEGFAEDTTDSPPPSPVGQDERRMQVRAYNHWASLLGDAPFPDIADLDPHGLEDFGPYSVLLDFGAGVEDPGVRFLGSELATECGAQDIAMLSDVPTRSLLSRITDHYMQILANQAPIGFEAEFVNERGNTALYRGILLPYSSDGETIDFIYGVINWKEVADRDTADALLLEIGQALGMDENEAPAPPAPSLDALLEFNRDDADDETDDEEVIGEARPEDEPALEDDILDLSIEASAIESDDLPMPAFGASLEDDARPQVPASMAPGTAAEAEWSFADASEPDAGEADDDFDHAPIGETAQDYGLDDEWDEPDFDDVDDVVDPLADESVGEGLSSLVTRGARLRPVVELPTALQTEPVDHEALDDHAEPTPLGPQEPVSVTPVEFARSDEMVAENNSSPFEPAPEVPLELGVEDVFETETVNETILELDTVAEPDEPEPFVADLTEEAEALPATDEPFAEPQSEDPGAASADAEGLYDTLAEAREMAATARNSEDRTRTALYDAVGRAYDFSLAAQDDPETFGELIEDAGLAVQDRAPMTPIVKLVFGSDYDKTRLTEYAAVLTHAHRINLGRGALASFLRSAEGGLKGVVQAERRARKEEAGKPVEDDKGVRAVLADKLRASAAVSVEDLPSEGPEFALVMVRRTADGRIELVGEIPEDVPMLEKAARALFR